MFVYLFFRVAKIIRRVDYRDDLLLKAQGSESVHYYGLIFRFYVFIIYSGNVLALIRSLFI